MGRRKLEVKYISDKAKRLKTLQNRTPGMFKKASQLSILVGCKVAIRIEFEGNVFEFAEDHSTNLPNGGAVPQNSENEYASSMHVPADSLSQQEAKDESLEDVFSQIPCWNDPFLELERDNNYSYDAVGQMDSLPEMIFPDVNEDLCSDLFNEINSLPMIFPDINENLTSGWICSSQDVLDI
ncbi:hypothetical protein SUGI_0167760 [Cryptomeria japonica]|nr:hypothetical protein SUGI_0167760 [Cryptomeria japonica]